MYLILRVLNGVVVYYKTKGEKQRLSDAVTLSCMHKTNDFTVNCFCTEGDLILVFFLGGLLIFFFQIRKCEIIKQYQPCEGSHFYYQYSFGEK